MSIKQNIERAKTDYDEVYEAGQNVIWDYLTNYGEKANYSGAFSSWGMEYFHPNRKITPTSANSGSSTFNGCKKLKKLEAAYLDFSQKKRGTSAQEGYYYTFYNCNEIEEIEDIGMQADYGYSNTFNNCPKLHTIAKIRADENTIFTNTFAYAYALTNIEFEGVIGKAISLQHSTKISKASIISLINALSTNTSGISATFSKTAVNKAFETSENAKDGAESVEWKTLIGTKSNWTISLA